MSLSYKAKRLADAYKKYKLGGLARVLSYKLWTKVNSRDQKGSSGEAPGSYKLSSRRLLKFSEDLPLDEEIILALAQKSLDHEFDLQSLVGVLRERKEQRYW